jgi:uncharacterized protein (DUF1697 family)
LRQLVLLRGVNVGGRNKLPMAALRDALEAAGMREVQTYLQSGNVVLDDAGASGELALRCERLIAERFGLSIAVIVRTRAQLARVVRRDPLASGADQPKLYQVSFCASKPSAAAIEKVAARAVEGERIVAHGSEIYAWFPHGVGRSRLAAQLAKQDLGVVATARNWTTVTKLLELLER